MGGSDEPLRHFQAHRCSRRQRPYRAHVLGYVRVNAFDETNAEMLKALPVHMHPSDGASELDWILLSWPTKG